MTIASEIQRIKNNIASAYSACQEKGAELPANQNSANLSLTISNITSGEVGETSRYGLNFDNLWGTVDANGNLQFPPSGDLVATGIVRIDDYILANMFGGNAYGVTKKRGIKSISFPDLTYVGNAAMYQFCTYTTDLISVSFPELENVGQCAMYNAFQHNSALKSASFPKLKRLTGMYNSLTSAFSNCPNLESVNLDSLEQMTSQALSSAFSSCSKLKTLSFPSLTTESFGQYSDQFNNMLSNVSGCTVHFPFRVKDIISSWNSVISGFGGTNTVILFDLHCAILNFVTTKTTCDYSINGRHITESSGYAEPGTAKYSCYDSSTNKLLIESVNDLEDDATYNIDIDSKLNANTNKITISTGVSGLDVYLIVNGLRAKAVEEATGTYVVNLISNGDEITYFIDGGNNYKDVTDSFTSNGSNKTITVSLSSATWVTFTRPNLTKNGTMGGENFAVADKNMLSTSYSAYKAFDSSATTYSWGQSTTSEITFYNPKPLKVSSLVIKYYQDSTSYQAKNITVYGSNDNEEWTYLAEIDYESGISRTINVNSNRGYKYHKLVCTVKSIYIMIADISINATYKE